VISLTMAAVRNHVAQFEMRDFYAETTPDGALRIRIARVNCLRDCHGKQSSLELERRRQ